MLSTAWPFILDPGHRKQSPYTQAACSHGGSPMAPNLWRWKNSGMPVSRAFILNAAVPPAQQEVYDHCTVDELTL